MTFAYIDHTPMHTSVSLERQVKGLLGGGEVTKRKRMSRARRRKLT